MPQSRTLAETTPTTHAMRLPQKPITWSLALLLLLAACNLRLPTPPPATPEPSPTAPPTPAPTPDPAFAGQPYQDARAWFEGVCFNYWVEQANRVFVIGGPFEHIALYNEVDESGLCRFPVERVPFDEFASRVLLGAVNVGTGCWAYTDPLELVRDDTARTVILRVRWGVYGECDYRLARPFWVSLPRPPEGYTVGFEFVPLLDESTGTPET